MATSRTVQEINSPGCWMLVLTNWQSDRSQPHLVNIQFRHLPVCLSACLSMKTSQTLANHQNGRDTHMRQMQVLANQQNGRDTHMRQMKVLANHQNGRDTHMRQMKVLANHQNSRDTHMRQMKVLSSIGKFPRCTTVDFMMYRTIRLHGGFRGFSGSE
uniref:Anaphase-promoting complex subunit 10 n=1 Tax=Hucho hucho TaxID=62062 RepID=A0A4W5JV73_9TELE